MAANKLTQEDTVTQSRHSDWNPPVTEGLTGRAAVEESDPTDHSLMIADLYPYRIQQLITGVESFEGSIRIAWDDRHLSEFHYTWLRDNCQCSCCRHPKTLELVLDQSSVPETISAQEAGLTAKGALHIVWRGDQHQSLYQPGWLRAHCYSERAREARHWQPKSWREGTASIPPRFEYEQIMSSDAALLNWLRSLQDYGVTLLCGVPTESQSVMKVAQHVSFVKQTNFGVIFEVYSMPEPTSNAYTSLELLLHTDLPHHEEAPGYQLLHCLINEAEGGESLLVDGFHLAQLMREQDPEAFALLTSLPVNHRYQDQQADHFFSGPLIVLNHAGEVKQIRFAPNVVAPLNVPVAQMQALRRSYHKFAAMTREPEFQVRLKFEAGDLVITDNHRVLHGRTAFKGLRRLQGCYWEHSEVLSRIRVLERKFDVEAAS